MSERIEKHSDFFGCKVTMPAPDEEERGHHEFSPSSAQRWMECPGSIQLRSTPLGKTLVERDRDRDHTAADRGSWMHTQLHVETPDYESMDDFERDQIDEVREYIRQQTLEYPTKAIHFELPVQLRCGLKLLTEGTVDVIIEQEGRIVVDEYKSGRWSVPTAEHNWQLKIYGAAVWQQYAAQLGQEHWCLTCLLQPQRFKDPYSQAFITAEEGRRYEAQVFRAQERCASPEVRFVPEERRCQFCPVNAICPAQSRHTSLVPKNAAEISGEQMARIYDDLKRIEKQAKAALACAKLLCMEGNLPGYEIKSKKGRASIPDAQAALDRCHDIISVKEFHEHVKVASITKFRDAFASAYAEKYDTTKKAGGEEFDTRMKAVIERGRESHEVIKAKEKRGP